MKLRINLRRRFPLEDVMLFVSALCVISFAMLENLNLAYPVFSMAKFPILYVGAVCTVFQIPLLLKNVRKRRYFYTCATLFLLCAGLLLTVYFNPSPKLGTNPVRHTLRLVLFLIELFALMIWAAEKGKVRYLMNFLFRYTLILTIITDFLFFTRIAVYYSGRHELFLVGTKFDISYLHMDLVTLWYLRNNMRFFRGNRAKRYVLLAAIFILAVSIRVNCMTGVIGCMALFCFLMLLNTPFQRQFLRFQSPALLCVFLLASVLFPFVVKGIMSIPFVEYFVEEVFQRDTSLTGRIIAFDMFTEKMAGHWIWGFGVGNGNVVCERLFGIANAQNAMLQWILEIGVPVTALLVALMVQIFRPIARSPWRNQVMPLVVLVYVYIILGTVEVTFSISFLLWLGMIFAQINEKNTPALPQTAP